jgi:hypothetical protein
MTNLRGVQLVSIPKSGTMFFSRCLERATGVAPVYGLNFMTAPQVEADLGKGRPEILAAFAETGPTLPLLARRYSQYRAKDRHEAAYRPDGLHFVSDHGLHSFARFLVDPQERDIVDPSALLAWAQAHRLQLVYLRRDLRAIANSLVHFLVDGRSRLVRIGELATATRLTCDLYMPVLAQQMRLWTPWARHPAVMALSFEELAADPAAIVARVCERAAMPITAGSVGDASENRAWTYRPDQSARWTDTFTASQQATLQRLEELSNGL